MAHVTHGASGIDPVLFVLFVLLPFAVFVAYAMAAVRDPAWNRRRTASFAFGVALVIAAMAAPVVLGLAMAAHATLAKLMYGYGFPRLPPGSGEVEAAAMLMYYGGDLAELAIAVALFAAWFRDRRGFRAGHQTRAMEPHLRGGIL